jgi:hypothetical protein
MGDGATVIMYDYTYLNARIVWEDDYGVCGQAFCDLCDRRFFRVGKTREHVIKGLRLLYRKHVAPDGKECLAGGKSYSYRSTPQRRQYDNDRYAREGKRNA